MAQWVKCLPYKPNDLSVERTGSIKLSSDNFVMDVIALTATPNKIKIKKIKFLKSQEKTKSKRKTCKYGACFQTSIIHYPFLLCCSLKSRILQNICVWCKEMEQGHRCRKPKDHSSNKLGSKFNKDLSE